MTLPAVQFWGDRLEQISVGGGTGDLPLGAVPTSKFAIGSIYAANVPFAYTAEGLDVDGEKDGQVEMGIGHLNVGGDLVRPSGNVTRSSNANALVNFTSVSIRVFVALTAAGLESWRPPTIDEFVPTLGQTVFTLSRVPPAGITRIQVFVRTGLQRRTVDYTLSGATLTWLNTDFTLAPGDIVTVAY